MIDPDPTVGSVMLYAGWQVDGEPHGAPNGGYLPAQLLQAAVNDPAVAAWLSHPVSVPTPFH
jgi:hypothetical protein